MHEKAPILKATPRPRLGSRYSKRYREQGMLPANVYGHGVDPLPVNLEWKPATTLINAGEKVFRLDLPGEDSKDEGQMVLLKELQFDYLGTHIIHADLARVDLNERVRTRVHIDLRGEAKGLKTAGAILVHPTAEIEVECRVVDIPDSIVVDITDLEVDGQITAEQVKLPLADMKLLTDAHAIVAAIVEQKEEVAAEATTVAAAGAAAPEVIGEKEKAAKAAADGKAPAAGAKAGAAPAKDAKAAPKK